MKSWSKYETFKKIAPKFQAIFLILVAAVLLYLETVSAVLLAGVYYFRCHAEIIATIYIVCLAIKIVGFKEHLKIRGYCS